MKLATPEYLYKYTSYETGLKILNSGNFRWSSSELFDEPFNIRQNPKLDFDHTSVSNAMLRTASAMIFTRDIPDGNHDHPLYKAIKRWRSEDRFHDEDEAFAALSELLAPTPESLKSNVASIQSEWSLLVEHARLLCFSDTFKDLQSWRLYAENHRGVVLRFNSEPNGTIGRAQPVNYSSNRNRLSSLKEQVDDLVGIQRALPSTEYASKLFIKPKADACEREWRCLRVVAEEDLDCGEDIEDWYLDEPFKPDELTAAYLGFAMSEEHRSEICQAIKATNPRAIIYIASATTDTYEIEFQKQRAQSSTVRPQAIAAR
jgi:hypothetical protein